MRVLERRRVPSLAYPGQVRDFIKVDFDERGGSPYDKMRMLRRMLDEGSQDPLINELASRIVLSCPERDDYSEVAALLAWCQSRIRYTEEGTETFRSAAYTASHGFGDCDDNGAILFGALCESIAIPVRLCVLSKRVGLFRYEPIHVYCLAGLPRRSPQEWIPAESTLHVPLGWDPAIWAREHADKL